MGSDGITKDVRETKNIVYWMFGLAGGWFADTYILQYLVGKTGEWLGIASELMATSYGFIFGLLVAYLFLSNFGGSLGIIVKALAVGYVANRITVLYMSAKGLDVDRWFLIIDTGQELTRTAATACMGVIM